MPKLCQIIAIENTVKSQTQRELTDAHHALQHPALLNGMSRTYQPRDDEGEALPPEGTKIQITAPDMLLMTRNIMTKLLDVTAVKDFANCTAKGDVIVDGKTLLSQVPVSYLLFLEKRLLDLETFVKKIPTLDPAVKWAYSPAQNCYASEPIQTLKTKKVPHNHVKAEATTQHPAQVEVFMEDDQIGTWTTVKFSGALETKHQAEMLGRITKLREAVKFAREDANGIEVSDVAVGKQVFDYVLAPVFATV